MNRLIQKMFESRGYTPEYISSVNTVERGLLLDIDDMCARLEAIYRSQRRILVFPDFDMDGIASGVIGFAGLSELGFNASLYVPEPSDGYGFSGDVVRKVMSQFPYIGAVLTCDVGITAHEGVSEFKSMGVEVLVTDHHVPGEWPVPADCIVNPRRVDDLYKNKQICGAYVLYQVIQRYADTYRTVYEQEQIRRLSVFAGIGTISDSMPLLYENRGIVSDAVMVLKMSHMYGSNEHFPFINGSDRYLRVFKGLNRLLRHLNLSVIDEDAIGFYIAPMFNSVKRMDGELSAAFAVFLASDPMPYIEYLSDLNERRKTLTAEAFDVLRYNAHPWAPYLYLSDAPRGVLGLLAQKVMSDTGLPSIVVRGASDSSQNAFAGSGRSPSWYPLMPRSRAAGFSVAGHDVAFGIHFKSQDELTAFCSFVHEDIKTFMPDAGPLARTEPDFIIAPDGSGDTYLDVPLFDGFLTELEKYKPFGVGFPAPDIELRFVAQHASWSIIGKDRTHLKVTLDYGFDVLCWNQADMHYLSQSSDLICVRGKLSRYEFNGTDGVQFTGNIVSGVRS